MSNLAHRQLVHHEKGERISIVWVECFFVCCKDSNEHGVYNKRLSWHRPYRFDIREEMHQVEKGVVAGEKACIVHGKRTLKAEAIRSSPTPPTG